jgi:PKD repeat protein
MQSKFAFLIALAVLGAALSGCLGAGDDDDGRGHDHDHGHDDNGHHDDPPGNVTNTPPMASLAASAEAGEAPFPVNFTLDGTDPDGGNITWTLDLGDGNETSGDALPQTHNHTYEVAGLYNVTFTVSDGIDVTVANLTINVTAGVAFEQFVLSGSADLPCSQCTAAGANTGAGFRAGMSGVDSVFGPIPAEAAGQPFTMVSSEGHPGISFRTDCTQGGSALEAHTGTDELAGVVPAGAGCALMWEDSFPMATLTLTIG